MSEIRDLMDTIPESDVQEGGSHTEGGTFTFDGFIQYHDHPSNPDSRFGFLPIIIQEIVKLDRGGDEECQLVFGLKSDVAKMRFGKVQKSDLSYLYKPLGLELAFPHGRVVRAESRDEFEAGSTFIAEQITYRAKVDGVEVPVVTLHLRCMAD